MAIGPPDKTIIQIWKERFWRLVLAIVTTFAYIAISTVVVMPHKEVGMVIAPLFVLLYWRIISKLATGNQFSLQITTNPEKLDQVYNVLFTVLFSLNLIVYMYQLVTLYKRTL